MNLDNKKKKIYVKAKRRGLLELDLAFSYIADNFLADMSEEETDLFDNFLDIADDTLLRWILKQEPYDKKYEVFFQILANKNKKLP